MAITFGIWHIVDHIGIIGMEPVIGEYIIDKTRLWESYKWNDLLVYDWPVHLSENSWMSENMLNDLFIALVFAQDYFAIEKKEEIESISWSQTIFYSQQLLKLSKRFQSMEVGHIDVTDVKNVFEFADEVSNLKPLIFPKG